MVKCGVIVVVVVVTKRCHGFEIYFWQLLFPGCAEGSAKVGEGGNDDGPPRGELVVAQGAVVGLEDGAEEERVDAWELLLVAKDFYGLEALQLGDGKRVDGRGDRVPLGFVREDEGEVALDGLEAGEVVGGDSFQGEFI